MQTISQFYGITISMTFEENEPPHFYAQYNEHIAAVNILSLEIIKGKITRRALNLILEWTELRQKELLNNWEKCSLNQQLDKVKPLH
jgi:hypothetical protein